MKSIPTVISSRDGERAIEIVLFEGTDRIRDRDATGYFFTIRLGPDEPESRLVVIFSGTVFYIGPEHLGLAEIEDRDTRFVQYALAAIGDFLDAGEVPEFTPGGTSAFGIECFSGRFQEWRDRSGARDEEVEAYLRSQVYWSWKFDHEALEVGGPDRLRLQQPLSRLDRIAKLHEGSDWTVSSRSGESIVLVPETAFVKAVRNGEISLVGTQPDSVTDPSEPSEPLPVSQGDPSPLQFVDEVRVADLKRLPESDFDLRKLISLCEELNVCYRSQCYHAVAALTRAVIDHVPPVLGCGKFSEIANNYTGGRSFSDSMKRLEGARKIADQHLHGQIRRTESLPTRVQVNFSAELDVLLGEIHRLLADRAKDEEA